MVHIKHILCPVDFSEFSRHAFDRAVAVARSYGADLTVLHVLPVPSAVPALPHGPEGHGAGARSIRCRRAEYQPVEGVPAVDAHHDQVGLSTEHIVRRATCPVLAVPALDGH
jgi:nucleotide-binding universal stress UspA family protein